MPATVTVKPGQCLLDIALHTSGSAEAAFAIARINGLSVTEDLAPGAELLTSGISDGNVAAYYAANRLLPASGNLHPDGIGYWVIGATLNVS